MSNDRTGDEPCNRCGETDRHGWIEGDCILPHRGHSTKLVDGAFICRPCVDRHRAWLVEIVDLYGGLSSVLLAGSTALEDTEYQKPRKAPASPSPLNLAAWALLHRSTLNDHIVDVDYIDGRRVETERDAYLGSNLPNIPRVLAGWAQAAYDANGWTADAPTDLSGAAAALTAQADVIAGIPDIDTYDTELRWVYRAVRHAHGLGSGARKPVGRCPSLDGHGRECGGPLWPDKHGGMAVDCGRCRRNYGEAFLRHLGGLLGHVDTPTAS